MADSEDIVTRFLVEGEDKLVSAYNDIAKATDKFLDVQKSASNVVEKTGDAVARAGSGFGKYTSALEKVSDSSERTTEALQRGENQFQQLADIAANAGGEVKAAFDNLISSSNRIDELTASLADLQAAYAAGGDDADVLAQSIADVEAELNTATNEVEQYGNELLALTGAGDSGAAAVEQFGNASERAGQQQEQATQKTTELLTAFSAIPGPVGNIASALAASGGSIGGFITALGGIGLAVSGAVAAFGFLRGAVDESVNYATSVSKITALTGESTQFISGLAEVADDASIALRGSGVTVDAVGASLQRFNALIGRGVDEFGNFTQANSKIKQAVTELGVSLTDSSGKLKSLQQLLPDLAEGFQRLGAGAQSTSIAKQLGLNELLPLLLQGREAVEAFNKAAVIDDATIQSAIKYQQALDGIDDAFRNLKIAVGKEILPTVTRELKIITKLFEDISSFKFEGIRFTTSFTDGAVGQLFSRIQQYRKELTDTEKLTQSLSAANTLTGSNGYESVTRGAQQYSNELRTLLTLEDRRRESGAQGSNADITSGSEQARAAAALQEQATALQAIGLARAAQASNTLAQAQAALAGQLNITSSAIGGQSAPLDKINQAKTAFDVLTGKTTVQVVAEGEALKALDAARAKNIISQEKQLSILLAYKEGNLDVRDVFIAAGAAGKPYIAALDQLGTLQKNATAGAKELAKANQENNDILGKQLANTTQTTTRVVSNKTTFGEGEKSIVTQDVIVNKVRLGEGFVQNLDAQIKGAFDNVGASLNPKPLDLVIAATGAKNIDDLVSKLATLPAQQRVDLVSQVIGKDNIDAFKLQLDSLPTQKQIDVALKTTGAKNIDELLATLTGGATNSDSARTIGVTLQALGVDNVKDAVAKLSELKSQEVQFTLKLLGAEDVAAAKELLDSTIVNVNGKEVAVNFAATGTEKVEDAKKAVEALKDKNVAVTATDKATQPVKTVQAARDALTDKEIFINANNSNALASIATVRSERDSLTDKTIILNVDAGVAIEKVRELRNEIRLVAGKTVFIDVVTRYSQVGNPPATTAKCFAAGTLITMANGTQKPIEFVCVGDEVQTFDHAINKISHNRVVKTFGNTTNEFAELAFSDGTSFLVTLEHEIYSIINAGYVPAKNLQIGATLIASDGGARILTNWRNTMQGGKTFNFEVANDHNYFASGILVHNISERIDEQIGGLRGSLARLSVFGNEGEYQRGQRLVLSALNGLGNSVENNATTNNNRNVTLAPTFNVATVNDANTALDTLRALAGSF